MTTSDEVIERGDRVRITDECRHTHLHDARGRVRWLVPARDGDGPGAVVDVDGRPPVVAVVPVDVLERVD
jgi:hypothetical protein